MEAVRVLRKTRQQREARRDPDLHSEKMQALEKSISEDTEKEEPENWKKTMKREAPVKLGEKRCSRNK